MNLKTIFGKKPKADTNTPNPYLNARRSWNNHVGNVIQQGQLGVFFGVLGMLIALAAVGGLTHIGAQSKFIPLVFQRDATGNTVSVTRADRAPEAQIDDFRTAAAEFVTSVRLVTPDVSLQRKAIFKAYSYISPNDPAAVKTNEFLNGSKEATPFARAATETVSVEVKSVIQQTPDSWQVDWVETVRARDGSPKGKPYTMRVLLTLYQGQTTTETTTDTLLLNPHVIIVRDFNWSKLL